MLPLLFAAAVAGTMPDYASLPPDLARAARAFDAAQVHGDRKVLERLLNDNYVLVDSADHEENKAEFIRDYTTPGFSFAPSTVERPIRRLLPNGAVLGGVVLATGVSQGKPYAMRLKFVDIWVKHYGRWQVVFTQATRTND